VGRGKLLEMVDLRYSTHVVYYFYPSLHYFARFARCSPSSSLLFEPRKA